jgi:hypothetical protein
LLWAEDSGRTAFPAAQWQTGDVWVQRLKLDLPPNMPPYSLQPELSIVTDQGMWPVSSGSDSIARTAFALPPIAVTGRPAPFDPPTETRAQFGDRLTLLEVGVAGTATPGLPLFIGSTWQALRDLDRDYALQIQLLRPDETPVAVVTQTLWADVYPTHQWRIGERITSNDPITVPPDLEAGAYSVRIRVVSADGSPLDAGNWTPVGGVQVAGRPHQFDSLPVDVQVDASFGEVARLVGYRLDRTHAQPGGEIVLTLIWQALRPTSDSYKVFTHLYDSQNALVGQHDSTPAGDAPTSSWLTDEYIADAHVLPIDAASIGPLHFNIGLYHSETLQRLAAFDANGARLPDDAVMIAIQ